MRAAVCVIDAGTAVTVDLIAPDGNHRGGIIVPGLGLLRDALLRDTSDIDSFVRQSEGPLADGDWYGRDTLSAVHRGTVFMLQSALQQAVAACHAEFPGAAVLLTGGDASVASELLAVETELHPHLVLEGLQILSEEQLDA